MVEYNCTCGPQQFGLPFCEVHRNKSLNSNEQVVHDECPSGSCFHGIESCKRFVFVKRSPSDTIAKHWTTLLPPFPNGAPYVMAGARCEFGAFPMVTFRPMQIAISTNSRAKLSVEFRLRNQCWEFGAIDSWNRRQGQIATSFIRELVGLDSVSPADKIAIAVTNYGKFASKVFAQVDGVMCMNL